MKKIWKAVLPALLVPVLVLPLFAFGQGVPIQVEPPPNPGSGAPTGVSTVSNILRLISRIVTWLSALFWAVAIIFVFWTAYLYLTAGGEEEKINKAHAQFKYTLIAIAVALLSTVFPTLIRSFLSGQ